MIKNKLDRMNLSEIKKLLLKKGFKIHKVPKYSFNKEFRSFFLIVLSSFILVFSFFVLPNAIDFGTKFFATPKIFENKSKKDFQDTLTGKNKKVASIDKEINLKNLFDDFFEFENLPTDTVRLSASTIQQLFKDTNYNLNEVRKKKIVKPVKITLLPKEIKEIESTKKRKELFIQIILPLIIEENNKIKLDRMRLFTILNKNNNTKSEKRWLKKKLNHYGVVNNDLSTLKVRMDEIPVSIAIAQAAKETGWGTSRFAVDGNALFGQWTWSEQGIKPAGADASSTHKVMKFKVLKASIRAYQRNLNTHSSYRDFRKARATQRDKNENLNSLELVTFLDKYAETGKEYTVILKKIIEQNSLTDFDDAKILPSSRRLKNII